jgi:fibronectin-binding autotransporter adhesin
MNSGKTQRGRRSTTHTGILAVSAAAAAVLGCGSVGFSQINTPVSITGFNGYEIYSGANNNQTTTQDFDAYSPWTFYYSSAPYAPAGTGLPTGAFTSAVNPNTTFQLAPANSAANNGFELNTAGNAENGPLGNVANPQLTSGTINFATPQAYTTLALLNADANGASTITYTLNFANGTTASGSFAGLDWFGSGGALQNNLGRVYPPYEYLTQYGTTYTTAPNSQYVYYNYSGTQPDLYEDDITVPSNDVTLPISSISFSMSSSGGSQWSLFAVSGDVTTINAVYTYTGAISNKFDNSTANFNFSGAATAFVNGNEALFDDTATGSHTVSVASGGVSPSSTVFNNSTSSYVITGPGSITGSGTLTVSGGGSVTLTNSNTYSGLTLVENGTLTIGAGGSIASPTVVILSGSTLNLNASSGGLSGGALTASGLSVTDSGTINVYGNANLGNLVGNGTLNVPTPGTLLTLTGGSFAGTLAANGSTLVLAGTGGVIAAPISDGSSPNSVLVSTTGSWTFAGGNSYSGGTNLSSGVAIAASAMPFGTGPVLLSGGQIGSTYAAGAVIPGKISGGALVIANVGAGTVELSGSNAFTGPITIEGTSGTNLAGTLQIDTPSALGAAKTITVQNGGTFLVNDNSGSAGLGTTLNITGTGVNNQGALAGSSIASATWAGNINTSGSSASIEAGASLTLTLTGSIVGSAPVVFSGNPNSTSAESLIAVNPSATSANTYTGETQILAGPGTGTSAGLYIQSGANNAFSPNSGINVLASNGTGLTVDLNGYNQSTQYLTGSSQTGYSITSSQGTSTLTVTSGLTNGSPAILSTAVTGNIALTMNDPTGAGNQILNASNSYTGGTKITKGTLSVANNNALGTGPITLNGGTLALIAAGSLTNSSFNSFTSNQSEGPGGTSAPFVTNGVLTLTNGTNGTANSAFYPLRVPVSDTAGFTANFTYSIPAGYADGMAFVLQNDPRGSAAVGAGGGELGYGGSTKIINSAAVEFNLYPFNSNGAGTQFQSGGEVPGDAGSSTATFQNTAPVNLALTNSGNDYDNADAVINVTLVYNGPAQTLTETLYNTIEQQTFVTTYTGIDYSALVGGPAGGTTSAYVGFTGGEGGANSVQNISNFSYTTSASASLLATNALSAVANTTSTIQIGGAFNTSNPVASVGAITIASGATIKLTTPSGTATSRGVLFTPSVSIASTAGAYSGKLDLASNDLVVTSSTIATVTAMVKQGYANGTWAGNGISSSAAASDSTHLTALGTIINDTGANNGNSTGTPLYTTLDGADLTNGGTLNADGEILVKYTYYGDTNLDGAVDGSDYANIDNGYLNHLTGWYNGDFNYDGVVDGSDYTLIDNAFNQQGASLGSNPAALLASATAEISGSSSAVPEPASLSLIAIGATALLGRRRRCH